MKLRMMIVLAWLLVSLTVVSTDAKEFDDDILGKDGISAELAEAAPNVTVSNFVQTEQGTTTNSIGMSWDPVENAIGYYIYDGNITDVKYPTYKSTTNSYVVENPTAGWHKYIVLAVGTDGEYLFSLGYSNYVEMKAASAVPNDIFGFDSGYNNNGELIVIWNEQADCDAYEVVAYDKNGIAVDQKEVAPFSYSQNAVKLNCPTGQLYQVRVRAINKNWNGEILCGNWSSVKYICIPKKFKSKLKSSASKTVITSWKKVNGASSYILYGSTKEKSGFKVIKKLSNKKTKVTYTKIKGKKFKYGKYYYVRLRIKANVKLDGKRAMKNFDAYRTFQINRSYY